MTLLNNKFKIRYLVLLVFLVFLTIFTVMGPSKSILAFYYYKNGDSVDINSYRVELPYMHWAYFGESEITYVVAGKDIGEHSLSAEFFKNTKDINIQDVLEGCNTLNKQKYIGVGLKGDIFLCINSGKETMYFQSGDQKMFIREDDYNSSIPEIVKEYTLLLDNISENK